jgi:sialate O-acetylesterase
MRFILLTFFVSFHALSYAAIRLPSIIGNNMVLQQQEKVRLWGWGEPGEKISVVTSWNQNMDSTQANGNGKWQIFVQTPAAGGPFTITLKGQNKIVLENVLIGEVWICSGQSNMEMNYNWGLPQMKEDFASAKNPAIRFFHVTKTTADAPQENCEGSWIVCDSNSVKSFSAVAYYFGRKLNEGLHVPVGLIHASWSGTPAEAWTPDDMIYGNQVLLKASETLKSSQWWPVLPGLAYNGMIAPVTKFNIAGAIWYQGESNTGTASTYSQLLTTMIESWRKKWNKIFPFYLVQIAPFNYGNNQIGAELREAQTATLSLTQTGLVVTTDLASDTNDIHPRNKRDVGYRLANLALSKTYHVNRGEVESPVFDHMEIDGNKIILSFQHTRAGLVSKDKVVKGFVIAGEDGIYHDADAKIKNNQIILSSKAVAHPVSVRYAFTNTAIGNVFSKEGLPLMPFRSLNHDLGGF